MSDSRDIDRYISELLEAGWTKITVGIWRAPGGGLWHGPHGAWRRMKSLKNGGAKDYVVGACDGTVMEREGET